MLAKKCPEILVSTDTLTDFHNLTSTTPLTGSVINKSEPELDNSNKTNQKAQNKYYALAR